MAQSAEKRLVRHGVIATVAAVGAMAASGAAATAAYADGAGTAQDSPGLLSGLSVQLPATVPVDLCGSTLAVAGLLDPASADHCANSGSGSTASGSTPTGGTGSGTVAPATPRSASVRAGGAGAGTAANSPGLLSGDGVHLPVALPVNLTGNTVSVVGLGSPASGNVSSNTSAPAPTSGVPDAPPQPSAAPPVALPVAQPPARRSLAVPPMLAHTGAQGVGDALAAGGVLLAGGLALYRRAGRRTTHPRGTH